MVELKAVAISVTIFLMFLNAGPVLLSESGVAEDMGIEPTVSGDQDIEQANRAMEENVSAEGGFGSTLFSLYTSVTQPVETVTDVVFAGPTMLISLGVPEWLVAFFFVPQYMIVGALIIFMLAGRRL